MNSRKFKHAGIAIVLILPFAASIYYAVALPISYDEAWTFLNFTNKGLWTSVSTYPAPNNHILHSVFTNFTKYIPGLDNLLRIRISPIVFNLAAILTIYLFVYKYYREKIALVIVAISSVLFMNIYYSYMSRGYSLLLWCFTVCLFCTVNIIHSQNTRKSWILFVVFSILGFYTVPSFLYPWITLNALILFFEKKHFRTQIIAAFIISSVTFLLYFPIFYGQGINAIISNKYVKPIGFLATAKSLPFYYLDTITAISGIHWSFIIILICLAYYKAVKSGNQFLRNLTIVFTMAPAILLLGHGTLPFARIFNYYGLIIILIVSLPYSEHIEKMNFKHLMLFLIMIQSLMILNFNSKIYQYEDRDLALNITADKIISQIAGDKKYLVNGSLLLSNLEFELIEMGYSNYEIEYIDFCDMSADTINDFDYTIINTAHDKTRAGIPVFKTKFYNVYKKK